MLATTTCVSLDRNMLSVEQRLADDHWFYTTLAKACIGFLTFYVWGAYKQLTVSRRIVWTALIMTVPNIATSAHIVAQFKHLAHSLFNEITEMGFLLNQLQVRETDTLVVRYTRVDGVNGPWLVCKVRDAKVDRAEPQMHRV